MSKTKLTIGTRGSDLALYQANFIKDILESEHNCYVDLNIIKTSGDKFDNLSFDKMEGKGFFTKELEDSLLNNEIDFAVHSLKDLMTSQPDGLKLGAVGFRADRRELLLINNDFYTGEGLIPVKDGAIFGTSSARRKCQIANHQPNLKIKDLRGNIPTRINKLRDGQYDSIIVAAAGVLRLNLDLSDIKSIYLDPEQFLPAPAQGILGIQIRKNDSRVENVIKKLNVQKEFEEASLERGLLAKFDAGCSLPLGVFSKIESNKFYLKTVLGQQSDNKWSGLKKLEFEGNNIESIINEAYGKLKV